MATEKSGSSTIWSETFNYDIYGNRWVSPNPPGLTLSALTVTSNVYSAVTNRLPSAPSDNFGYDSAGNETKISPFSVTYDVENRQTGFTSTSNGTATYTYDGDGRRVTKTTGGVTTTYVYDATGDLASEYSTQPPPPPCLTCYVTTDHLGSTRVVTDENAAVTARHDFLPFGEELTASNRTAALGYGAYDNVMHKYTGQMRDTEGPGLDFFHARYFHDAQGRFTSPDELTKDSHVTNPQSWNKYAYARNNPLRYVDPTGEKADVTVDCNNDTKTCQVSIQASIAVYANAGANLDQAALNAAAEAIQNSIQAEWTGAFQENGFTYNVNTQVQVQAFGSEQAALKSGAGNVIALANGDAIPGRADSYVNPRSLLSAITGSGPDTGTWNINSIAQGVAAHEFTHLLGVGDKLGAVLSNTNILNDPNIPRHATAADFRFAVREAVDENRNMTRADRQILGAPANRMATETEVQSAWRWWK